MFTIIAKEMGLPWRAVESTFWEMGQENLAIRINVPVQSKSSSLKRETPGGTGGANTRVRRRKKTDPIEE
jgi:hypothetical protein